MLPYFRKAEDNERGADDCHGAGGPLSVSDLRDSIRCRGVHRAARAVRLSAQRRLQRRDPGRRRLLPDDHAQRRALLDRRGLPAPARAPQPARRVERARHARAVRGRAPSASSICDGDETQTAHADGEVILAGGAFNSPQLLQLSGLGPAALLRAHGIPVVADLPGVGDDLQDHYFARIDPRATQPISVERRLTQLAARCRGGLRLRAVPARLLRDARRSRRRLPARAADRETPDIQCPIVLFSVDDPATRSMRFPASPDR